MKPLSSGVQRESVKDRWKTNMALRKEKVILFFLIHYKQSVETKVSSSSKAHSHKSA